MRIVFRARHGNYKNWEDYIQSTSFRKTLYGSLMSTADKWDTRSSVYAVSSHSTDTELFYSTYAFETD